jgi:hypothetical protein
MKLVIKPINFVTDLDKSRYNVSELCFLKKSIFSQRKVFCTYYKEVPEVKILIDKSSEL